MMLTEENDCIIWYTHMQTNTCKYAMSNTHACMPEYTVIGNYDPIVHSTKHTKLSVVMNIFCQLSVHAFDYHNTNIKHRNMQVQS